MTRKVSVIGLGYVGLPVAVAFGNIGRCIGFDINAERISELKKGIDRTHEFNSKELESSNIEMTSTPEILAEADFHIVTVPTPVDSSLRPDLSCLVSASATVGGILKKNDIVVFESTVYPGTTEEVCVPVLEQHSGLKCGTDFFVGYSPERINPSDGEHSLANTVKVVAAQNEETLSIVAEMYGLIVKAGIYKATTIKVAESAKVIENTQRDLNIALVNELSHIFRKVNVDTKEVLEAAATKWNFAHYKPGLVGGHCIGVDPYYLTYKAEQVGYRPQVILAGRRINDDMGKEVAQETIKQLIKSGHAVRGSIVTLMGLTFKENCSDIRNTKVVDIISTLREYEVMVQVHDPLANVQEAWKHYQVELSPLEKLIPSQAVIFAVAHNQFKDIGLPQLKNMMSPNPVLLDLKYLFEANEAQDNGFAYWRL